MVSQRDVAGVPMVSPTVSRLLPVLRVGVVRPLVERDTLRAVVKANVGRYARAPSFFELYGNGTGRIVGNTDLVSERGSNADVGLWIDRVGPARHGDQPDGRVRRAGRRSHPVAALAPWGQARADNLARARILGVEQELRLGLGRHARLVGQATYLDARDRSDNTATNDNQLPFHPRYRWLRAARVGARGRGRRLRAGGVRGRRDARGQLRRRRQPGSPSEPACCLAAASAWRGRAPTCA